MKLSFEFLILVLVWVALRCKLYILIRGWVLTAFVLTELFFPKLTAFSKEQFIVLLITNNRCFQNIQPIKF